MQGQKLQKARVRKINYLYNKYKLPDTSVLWIRDNSVAIVAPDFEGYIFKVDPLHHVCGLLSINGLFLLMSTNVKRPLISVYRLKQTFRKLLRNGFLEYNTPEVFEEFALRNNVPFDRNLATHSDVKVFF